VYDAVDDIITLSFLACIYNPMTMFQAAVCNMETGELGAPPPHHRMLVARRMQLTAWQVQWMTLGVCKPA
jgi:hypothetical protein